MTDNTADEQRLSMAFLQPKVKKDKQANIALSDSYSIAIINQAAISIRIIESKKERLYEVFKLSKEGSLEEWGGTDERLGKMKSQENPTFSVFNRKELIEILDGMSSTLVKISIESNRPGIISEPCEGEYRREGVIAPCIDDENWKDWDRWEEEEELS